MRKVLAIVMLIVTGVAANSSFASDNQIKNSYDLARKRLDSGVNVAGEVEYKRIHDFIIIRHRQPADKTFAIVRSSDSNGYMTISCQNDSPYLAFSGAFMGEEATKGNKIEFRTDYKDKQFASLPIVKNSNVQIGKDFCTLHPGVSKAMCELISILTTAPHTVSKLTVKITPNNQKSVEQTFSITGFSKALNTVCPQ